ncbi:MAG: hypothetical protein KAI81_05095 [Candidatus Marinimicrobia bacterium]|nr:hypothetical protein [Candidatus Neomarinimicrobiota bacterium]
MKILNFKFNLDDILDDTLDGTLDDILKKIRTHLIYAILFVLCALGTPTIIIASIEAYQLKLYNSIIVYLLFLIPIIPLTIFRKKFSYRFIAATVISLGQIIAISNLVIYGTGGAGIEIFFTIFVLTTIFFNLKSGLYMILFSGIATSIIGYLYTHNYLILKFSLDEISTKPLTWITALAVLIFLGVFIVLSYGLIQSQMMHSTQQALINSDNFKKTNLQLINDIKERKQFEKERENISKALGVVEMAGAAAHELNQPLQTILMLSELTLLSTDKSDPNFENIEKISEGITQLGELTNKIQTVAIENSYTIKEYFSGENIVDLDSVEAKDLV